MRKNLLFTALSVMAVFMNPTNTYAQVEGTDYEVSESSYHVKTAAGMAYVAGLVNEGKSVTAVTLEGDLDLSSTPWTPMGTTDHPFSGVFDGAGYTIDGMNVTLSEEEARKGNGFIGVANGATVKNLTIGANSSLDIKASKSVNAQFVGTVVGQAVDVVISNCTSKATVSSQGNSTGGIVGDATGYKTVISNCANYGNITSGGSMTGGIAGRVGENLSVSKIYNCFNTGDVSSNSAAGGVVGMLQSPTASKQDANNIVRSMAYNCYNTGNITTVKNLAGGVVGSANFYSAIENCVSYATAIVCSNLNAGGVVGNTSGEGETATIVEDCYYVENSVTMSKEGETPNTWGTASTVETLTSAEFLATLSSNAQVLSAEAGLPLCAWTTSDGSVTFGDASVSGWADLASAAVAGTDYTVDGTSFTVSTALGLAYVASLVNTGTEVSAVTLTGTINLGGVLAWTPIGTEENKFKGAFDGAGYTVDGMNLVADDLARVGNGLFGNAEDASIKNLTIGANSVIDIKTSKANNAKFFGAVLGSANNVVIDNCHNKATVNNQGSYTGGIVGDVIGYNSVISNCSNTADVTSNSTVVGGIAGRLGENMSVSKLYNCFNTGHITSNTTAGGIVGMLQSPTASKQDAANIVRSSVYNCYNTGDITSVLVDGKGGNFAGGIVGSANVYSEMKNCVSAASAISCGNKNAGGIVGGVSGSDETASVIDNCYYLENVVTVAKEGEEANEIGTACDATTLNSTDLATTMTTYAGTLANETGYGLLSWTTGSDCVVFGENMATGIARIAVDDTSIAAEGIYSVDGVRRSSLQKGLNIVKNGNTVKKVIVK